MDKNSNERNSNQQAQQNANSNQRNQSNQNQPDKNDIVFQQNSQDRESKNSPSAEKNFDASRKTSERQNNDVESCNRSSEKTAPPRH
jgi:hypothetical protein